MYGRTVFGVGQLAMIGSSLPASSPMITSSPGKGMIGIGAGLMTGPPPGAFGSTGTGVKISSGNSGSNPGGMYGNPELGSSPGNRIGGCVGSVGMVHGSVVMGGIGSIGYGSGTI